MLITTPEELRSLLPSHLYRNLDTVRGYLLLSELSFLRQRIGKPLLSELNARYAELGPIVGKPIGNEGSVADEQSILTDPWPSLINLCQRCIAFDGMYRSAGIRRVSDNDMGMNVAESDNFAAVDKDRFSEYKIDLYKNAHTSSDLLLSQLQEWEGEVAAADQQEPDGDADNSILSEDIKTIVSLWRQSSTYPLTDGLLFTTATEFNQYVSIEESLDKFVQLLPDIRYCQELHLEAEVGPELLTYLHDGHRSGTLTPSQAKAYTKLQRCLSLYVEARAKMFNRPAARDEAQGYMHLTREYIRNHQTDLPHPIISLSPLYNPSLWHFDTEKNQYVPLSSVTSQPSSQSQNQCHAQNGASVNASKEKGKCDYTTNCDCSGTMLISTLI